MEYLDICDENGIPTGQTVSRAEAHDKGILHRTAHVWLVRKDGGAWQILMQKRSQEKESFPGMYDTSAAGHISAGDEPLPSAQRELQEELGVPAGSQDLVYAGHFHIRYELVFHGALFRDNEYANVYVYRKPGCGFDADPIPLSGLRLQDSEVESARWFDLETVCREIRTDRTRFCVAAESLEVLKRFLARMTVPPSNPVYRGGRQ